MVYPLIVGQTLCIFSTSKILIQFHTVAQISGNRARFDIHKSTTNARLSAHPGGNNTDHGISAFEGL